MDTNCVKKNQGSMMVCNRYQDKGRRARDVVEEYICKASAMHIGQIEHDDDMCYSFLDKRRNAG